MVYCENRCLDKQETRKKETRWSHIENGNEEPVEKCDGDANVGRSPPRGGKRGAVVRDLTPVEGENTHGKTMGNPKGVTGAVAAGKVNVIDAPGMDTGEAGMAAAKGEERWGKPERRISSIGTYLNFKRSALPFGHKFRSDRNVGPHGTHLC